MLRKAVFLLQLSFALALLFSVFSWSLMSVAVGERSEDEAASSLVDAEEEMKMAYLAVLRAEEAGANVAHLLSSLNEAGVFLGEARIAFRLADFDKSVTLSVQSEGNAVKVQGDAIMLENLALMEGLQRKTLTIVLSVIGLVLTVFLSLGCWHIFKRRYFRRVLTMKPEVNSHGS